MKKQWIALLAVLCMALGCAWGAAGESSAAAVGTEEAFRAALEDDSITEIKLTADITLTQNVTIRRNVSINLEGDYAIYGSGAALTIDEGITVELGDLRQAATDNVTGLGKIYVPVVNRGTILGTTSFYGKVTNYGLIAGGDIFYGEYEAMAGGINHSTIKLILDAGDYVLDGSYDGWLPMYNGYPERIYRDDIIRGQRMGDVLPEISRRGWKLLGWYDGGGSGGRGRYAHGSAARKSPERKMGI